MRHGFLLLSVCALAATGCDGSNHLSSRCGLGTRSVLVTTSDFMTGKLSEVDLESGAVRSVALDDQDSGASWLGCRPVVLERARGRIRVQDPNDPLVTLRTIDVNPAGSTGPYASNPIDLVELEDGTAYAILGTANEIAIVDLEDNTPLGRIDLSPLVSAADLDGKVDATGAVRIGGRVYVGLARYHFDAMFGIHFDAGSVIAVIDATTHELVDTDTNEAGVQGIALEHANPWRGLAADGNRLLVGATGDSFAIDGAIDAIDLTTFATTTLLTEEAAGGEIGGFVQTEGALLVLVGGALRPLEGGALGAEIAEGASGATIAGGQLLVWGKTEPAFRTFDLDTLEETTPKAAPTQITDLPEIIGVGVAP